MRFPIRLQLMFATLLVAITAIALASAASIYLAVSVAARNKAQELSRIEETLAQTNYPLTESVLRQMRGFSGAEFVLLDANRAVIRATIELGDEDRALLKSAPTRQHIESLAEAPEIRLAGLAYFGHILPATREASAPMGQLLVVLYGKEKWWAVARQVSLPIVGAGGGRHLARDCPYYVHGRLAGTSDPSSQGPVRTNRGRKIRSCFADSAERRAGGLGDLDQSNDGATQTV